MTSGIYEIRNIQNNKTYIGSSADLDGRFVLHRNTLRRGKHDNQHLQRAWNKYGEDMFEFCVLINCPESDLILLEQTLMDANHPEYNMCPIAGRTFGYKHTDESRKKMSLAAKNRPPISEETRRRMSEAQKRKIFTEEHRKNLSEAGKGHECSEERRRKISKARKAYYARVRLTEEGRRKLSEYAKRGNETRRGKQ